MIPEDSKHEQTGQRITDGAERDDDVLLAYAGFRAAHQVVVGLAVRQGSKVLLRSPGQDGQPTVRDVEPMFGLRAAYDLELGARSTVRQYMMAARAAGHSREDIGRWVGFVPQISQGTTGRTPAEVAFSYASGRPDSPLTRRLPRTFEWICRSCDARIADLGPAGAPIDSEVGHADGCAGFAATMSAQAAHEAQLEAEA